MPEMHLPWLEFSVLIPLVGSLIVFLISSPDTARRYSILICSLTLACTIGEWLDFNTLHTFEAHDHWDVCSALLGRDMFVIDELSAPLLPVAGLICLMTVLTTLRTKITRFSFGLTLLSEALLLATFSCREPWPLIFLLSLSIVPPLIELRTRRRSVRFFSLHMTAFVLLLVTGQALVPDTSTAEHAPVLASCLLVAAALLRSGAVPMHCWLTDLFEKASFGTALLFVTPMTGAYAIMRLVLPIAPDWTLHTISMISLLTAIYAAGMALVQHDARRFFCFIFLSHSSLVLTGVEMATPVGLTGALCVWLSVSISLLGFGLTLRSVEARTGRISLATFHGLFEHTPYLAALFLVTGLASIGFPGTIGFIGSELLVEGGLKLSPLIGVTVVLTAMLNGVSVVLAYFRVFTGTRHIGASMLQCRPAERVAILALVLLILGGGLYPQPSVSSRYHAAMHLLSQRNAASAAEPAAGEHGESPETTAMQPPRINPQPNESQPESTVSQSAE